MDIRSFLLHEDSPELRQMVDEAYQWAAANKLRIGVEAYCTKRGNNSKKSEAVDCIRKCFLGGIGVREASRLLGFSKDTISTYYRKFRHMTYSSDGLLSHAGVPGAEAK